MRDMISRAKFINLPIANETQNSYMRALKLPDTLPKTRFDDIAELTQGFDVSKIRTIYSDIWDGGSNG